MKQKDKTNQENAKLRELLIKSPKDLNEKLLSTKRGYLRYAEKKRKLPQGYFLESGRQAYSNNVGLNTIIQDDKITVEFNQFYSGNAKDTLNKLAFELHFNESDIFAGMLSNFLHNIFLGEKDLSYHKKIFANKALEILIKNRETKILTEETSILKNELVDVIDNLYEKECSDDLLHLDEGGQGFAYKISPNKYDYGQNFKFNILSDLCENDISKKELRELRDESLKFQISYFNCHVFDFIDDFYCDSIKELTLRKQGYHGKELLLTSAKENKDKIANKYKETWNNFLDSVYTLQKETQLEILKYMGQNFNPIYLEMICKGISRCE
ncbi:MAG: hypothetical protein ACOYT4_02810 [Nanoarchaeota archaeon]